jgi:uncharacterized NAD-dependent epimerase/dehydratase family protein
VHRRSLSLFSLSFCFRFAEEIARKFAATPTGQLSTDSQAVLEVAGSEVIPAIPEAVASPATESIVLEAAEPETTEP